MNDYLSHPPTNAAQAMRQFEHEKLLMEKQTQKDSALFNIANNSDKQVSLLQDQIIKLQNHSSVLDKQIIELKEQNKTQKDSNDKLSEILKIQQQELLESNKELKKSIRREKIFFSITLIIAIAGLFLG